MTDGSEWFEPKRYGFGARPVSWQGWAILLAYIALLGAAKFLMRDNLFGFASIVSMLTAALIAITARTTRGGLRWRWGDDE